MNYNISNQYIAAHRSTAGSPLLYNYHYNYNYDELQY